ncbi:MAG: ABC transporter permease [Candidatus Nanohaloarchaea archaeon]
MGYIDINAVHALWRREMTRLKRSPSRIVGGLSMPLLFMVFLGFGFGTMDLGGMPERVSYIQYLVPGIVGMTMLFSGSFAGMSLLWDREHGFLKEVMVAPSSRLSIVIGRIAGGGTLSVVQGLLVVAASFFLGFHVKSVAGLLLGTVFLVLIAAAFIGLGMIFASRMQDSQGFGLVMNLVIFPLFFLSGAIFPVENLPTPLEYAAYLNPLTYGIDGMRAAFIGVSIHGLLLDLAVLVVSTSLLLGLGTYAFEGMEVT